MRSRLLWTLLLVQLAAYAIAAQTTEFTYQGQLQSSAAVASGNFDFEFALFDAPAGGSQVGTTQTRSAVAVSNGIFSVSLDFGSVFPGANRYLEIRVRQSGGGALTTLSPRQPLNSSPYSVKSLSANSADSAATAGTFTGNLAGDVTGTQASTSVTKLRGRTVSTAQPNNGQVLKFNTATSQWEPALDETGSGGGSITAVTAGNGLTGGGTSGNVQLGISSGGVTSTELAANAVTTAKVADSNITNAKISDVAGGKITGSITTATIPGANVSGAVANSTSAVNFSGTLSGDISGTQSATSISNGAVSNAKLFDGAVTDAKIASGQVVKSINSLRDNVTLAAGANVTITPSGNTLTFSSTAGAVNAILNQIAPQSGANFNISGNGTVGGTLSGNAIFSSSSYGIGSFEILSARGANNIFAGVVSGSANTTGNSNAFYGAFAGSGNSSGTGNSFFGASAGNGTNSGSENVFIGRSAGRSNSIGSNNTAIGDSADVSSGSLTNATAIGANAAVQASNSLVLGSITGVNSATSNTRVGIGIAAPNTVLHIRGDGPNGLGTGDLLIEGFGNVGSAISLRANLAPREYSWIATGPGASSGAGRLAAFDVTAGAYRMVIDSTGRIGIGTTSPDNLLTVNGTANKPGGGSWGTFSDERLKKINGSFTSGLNELMKLEPIRYKYKPENPLDLESDSEHIGFSAQAVQKVIPEAVTTTDKGYLLLNNDPILWTMLNAIKEQQEMIEKQQSVIAALSKTKQAFESRLNKLESRFVRRGKGKRSR